MSLCKKASNHHANLPWKYPVLHCNHLGSTWKPLVLMTRHFDYCPSASEGDNQSVRSSAPVVSRCFPGGYNVKLDISRGRLAWWLMAFLCCVCDLLTALGYIIGYFTGHSLYLQGPISKHMEDTASFTSHCYYVVMYIH